MYDGKVKGFRNFANKIWNSARFVLDFKGEGIEGLEKLPEIYEKTIFTHPELISDFIQDVGELNEESKVILQKLEDVRKLTCESIEKYRFSDAAVALYEFYWHEFCDKYIEYAKDKREGTQKVLEFVLKSSMEMLHPFMPFVTEEIWQKAPHLGKSVSVVK
jgi:valyl-tRNA synthetase